jgi:hypothetical protein
MKKEGSWSPSFLYAGEHGKRSIILGVFPMNDEIKLNEGLPPASGLERV